ncbi:MAG: coproporphyrinogen dehydrogenase HemZ [Clostridia bacterium]|nr:coproporphyrinogen dehydrogenase HemZ [Clostridia bacterium]
MNNIRARFIFDAQAYLNDVQDIPRAFSPYFVIDDGAEAFLRADYEDTQGQFFVNITSSFAPPVTLQTDADKSDFCAYKKKTKHFLKNCLYDYLSQSLEVSLPYGSLTGVRPTKLFYELSDDETITSDILSANFRVSAEKTALIAEVVENQKGIYSRDARNCDIFINIPFCPTRCNYCSFISSEVGRVKKLLPDYVKAVSAEVLAIKKHISENALMLRSVYVGGGTPTSIGEEYLEGIILPLADCGTEFTVEAGRPDTIDPSMLAMLKRNNVTRLSINPQSFNQKTLDLIGRRHTVDEIYQAYAWAKNLGFDVNMDLIAMLEGESAEDFCFSVDKALELEPQNITVHTLSLKRGAVIADREKQSFGLAERMINYAHQRLFAEGYKPYYMYRQKNMADNLENTGFCKTGKACVYNIDMMEETTSIFAAGAGGMSKFALPPNRLERRSNPKGIYEYLERILSIIESKFTQ